jgi:type III secretion protein T
VDTAAAELLYREGITALSALVLGSMRMLGLTFTFPLFTWTRITGPLRMAFALAVSLPVTFGVHGSLSQGGDPGTTLLVALMLKEFVLGAAIGLALAVPFWGAQAAGDVIELYRGASAANLVDPLNASETSVLGSVLIQFTLALFVVSGGLLTLIGTVFETYRAWPSTSLAPGFGLEAASAVGTLVLGLLRIGLILAGPMLLAMLLADLGLMLLARGAQQFPLFDLSVTAKNLAVLMLAPAYALFFQAYLTDEWSRAVGVLKALMGLP